MAQTGERKVVLFPQTQTAVGPATVADTNPLSIAYYTAAIFILNVTAQAGTTPTLDVYIQQEIPIAGASDKWGVVPSGTSVWDDVAHFTQVTSTGAFLAYVVAGGNAANAQKDASLTAASVRNGPIGGNIRIKYVTAGTSPQYTFSVSAILIP